MIFFTDFCPDFLKMHCCPAGAVPREGEGKSKSTRRFLLMTAASSFLYGKRCLKIQTGVEYLIVVLEVMIFHFVDPTRLPLYGQISSLSAKQYLSHSGPKILAARPPLSSRYRGRGRGHSLAPSTSQTRCGEDNDHVIALCIVPCLLSFAVDERATLSDGELVVSR